ncbi:unnamed protein product [Peronospora belbahrii]|uniref:Uncharacterized protein n=1 Tax=Peronospora belbahrii TaxID=622444 RepID=A0AAU9LCX9_9STRA|nr:unnamed protein product [Peronospora belbahrii]CAH0515862.1 unnamed protein product [Peronospora belbahrii]
MTPPPQAGHVGPAPPMPPQVQAMMQEMYKKQPKLQQNQQMQPPVPYQQYQGGRGRGRNSGRGRGRGRGRGGFQQQHYRQNRGHNKFQCKRLRGTKDDVQDASRFYLPSFLEDPWKALEGGNEQGSEKDHDMVGNTQVGEGTQSRERVQVRHQEQCVAKDELGRVLFQPSFLEDPWISF